LFGALSPIVQNWCRLFRRAFAILVLGLVVVQTGNLPCAHADDARKDALEDARALMTAGAFDEAERRAREVIAMSPGRGEAHLVLGLAQFRAGRYQDALASFAEARSSASPASPGPVAFNEGSALFALGQYSQARNAFAEAARIAPALAFLATVNVAESALAMGDFTAAARYVATAKALASTQDRQELLGDLSERIDRETVQTRRREREERAEEARAALASNRPADAAALYEALLVDRIPPALTNSERNVWEHALGLALLRLDRQDDAARHFAQAALLDSRDGDSLYMEGIARYRRGEWIASRRLFQQSLRRDLDGQTDASARAFLDRLSFGSRRAGGGGTVGLSAGTGYDSNVIQGADSRPETIAADQVGKAGAFFATSDVNAGYEWLVRGTGFLAAEYDLDQLAYPDPDHQDYSLQDHNVRLRGEWSPSSWVRAGMMVGEELQFSGLSGFHAFQNVLTGEPFLAFDELPYTSTQLRVRFQEKSALDHSYDYYSGSRMDLRLDQRFRWGRLRGDVAFRHRRERIGTRSATLLQVGTSQSFKFRKTKPTDPVDEASYVYVAPYAYDANAVLAGLDVGLGAWRISADASAEIQDFRGDSMVYFVVPTMQVNRLYQTQRRRDLHVAGSLTVAAKLSARVELALRYDIIDNRSTLVLDVDDRNYFKQVVTMTVGADW